MSRTGQRVFVSYSNSDQEYAAGIFREMATSGMSVWTDNELMVGSDWATEIEDALEESDVVVILVSPNSVASEWVNFELGFALSAAKKVVPVLINDAELPGPLRSVSFIDARDMTPEEAGRRIVQSAK
jgi:predicted nucleotide-binding protein